MTEDQGTDLHAVRANVESSTDSSGGGTVDVLAVGAGFSGVGVAIALKEQGFSDIVILERGHDVGGTWRDNHYPGAACDVPSHLYSYSFALNPDWSRAFSPQAEIYDYIRRTAIEYGVREHIRFGVEVEEATWDPTRGRWTVRTSEGTWDARVLILGVGALCEPKLPEIEGIENFAGPIFHSSRWDHSTPLTGKRVAVIGTGASAIQIVPSIVDQVAHMDVFQRSAPWIVPRCDRQYSTLERKAYRKVPGLQRAMRGLQWVSREFQVVGLAKNPAGLLPIKAASRALLYALVRDKVKRKALTPTYQMGCKRILISNTFYPAIDRDHVDLVTSPILRVTPDGVLTADGVEHQADVLIAATGFHVTDSPFFGRVHDADGRSLADRWRTEGMEAYKGTTVSGFPNMFVLVGPATGLGHSSMVYMIESQIRYLVAALSRMREDGMSSVSVREQVQKSYNADLREATAKTVWVTGGCSSWYLDDQGNAPKVWPHFTFTFRNLTREFDAESYDMSHPVPAADEPASAQSRG